MSRWPEKYVIGLTGNIATGKSIVRRMLEHLGAYGIDADAISHRVIEKGAPGYAAVVQAFGRYVLNPQEEIDRKRLGRIVFGDPEGLQMLESIIHPLVSRAIDLIIQRSASDIVVIEAIKLLEGSLGRNCSSIWVAYAPPETQLERLVSRRNLSEEEALQRIQAQTPQEEKIRRADVVIRNDAALEDTWRQVLDAWKKFVPAEHKSAAETRPLQNKKNNQLVVEAARPSDAQEIAAFYRNVIQQNGKLGSEAGVIDALGEKAVLLLRQDASLVGIAGWHVENLVSCTTDLFVSPAIVKENGLSNLIEYIESKSMALQCEVSMIFARPELAQMSALWEKSGYQPVEPEKLDAPVWTEVARESQPEDTILLLKKLREDRILRPI